MRKKISIIFLSLFFLIACSDKKNNKLQISGKTMGTQYHITVILNPKIQTNKHILKKNVDALLLEINRQMSTYDSDSEISQFNQYQKTDWFPVSKDFSFVVSSAQAVSKATQGAFDITVAPLIDLWGFGTKTQLTIPSAQQISKALGNIGYKDLEVSISPPAIRKLNKNLRIDLSAIAKGFAVDKVAEYLSGQGYSDYLVEIGGEIRNQGFNQSHKPWSIGIEIPEYNDRRVNEILLTSNVSIATSGDYRNFFIEKGERYSHTINPITGRPIKHKLASVTVLHESTMIADAFATALMVLGDKRGKILAKEQQLRVNMITREGDDYQVWQTIDKTKIAQSQARCVKVGGCAYIK